MLFVWLQLVLSLTALVHARPEAGYSYSSPAASAPAPSAAYGAPALSAGSSGAFSSATPISYASIPAQYAAPASGISYVSSSAPAASFGSSSFANANFAAAPSAGLSFSNAGFNSANSFSSSAEAAASFAPSSGATLIQKHIYVHVPPPEQEEFNPPKTYSFPAPQKHYKIIFIKAPTPPTPTAPTIPLQPQNEEKTLVYVLVKKPEDAPEITIPTPAPTQPSKPEVYFIRYKTQKESVAAAADGVSIADAGAADLDTVVVGAGRSGVSAGAALTSAPAASSAGVSSSYGPPGYKPGSL